MKVEMAVLIVWSLTQASILWLAIALRREVSTLRTRIARQADVLALLTETSEAGFSAIARELERAGAAGAAKSSRRPDTRRLKAAARRGRSVAEIAAAEEMSEGEVRLRLHLANAAAAQSSPPADAPRPTGN